jgi:hypothetical protein
VLDPDGASRECPIAGAIKADCQVVIWNREPTTFYGVIGPERHVDVVRHDALCDRKRSEIGEDAGGGEVCGERRAIGGGVVNDSLDLGVVTLPERGVEDVAV